MDFLINALSKVRTQNLTECPSHWLNEVAGLNIVQKFNGNFELGVLPQPLPQAAEDILGVLGSGGVAAEATVLANVLKSDVTY